MVNLPRKFRVYSTSSPLNLALLKVFADYENDICISMKQECRGKLKAILQQFPETN